MILDRKSNMAELMVNKAWEQLEAKFARKYAYVEIGSNTSARLNDEHRFGKNKLTYEQYLVSEKKLSDSPYPQMAQIDDRLRIIAESMDYLQMSPDLAEEHRDTYIIDDRDDTVLDVDILLKQPVAPVINESKQTAKLILDYWRSKALSVSKFTNEKIRDSSRKLRKDYYNDRFLLLGQPGVGKTAFLNYLFSTNGADLRKEKILWVRVAVNASSEQPPNLHEKLYIKFLRIFCHKYLYDIETDFRDDFMRGLEASLIAKVTKERFFDRLISFTEKKKVVFSFIDMMKRLYDIKDDERQKVDIVKVISFAKMEEQYLYSFIIHTMTYIQENYDYGYIFIFDGLDSVTIDYIRHDICKMWMEQLNSATDNAVNPFKAVYIVSMREYSFIDFYLRHIFEIPNRYIKFQIIPQSAGNVLGAKYKLSIKRLNANGYAFGITTVKNVIHNTIHLIRYILFDVAEVDKNEQSGSSEEEFFTQFCNLNAGNLRSTFRLLRDIIRITYGVLQDQAFPVMAINPDGKKLFSAISGQEWKYYRFMLQADEKPGVYRNRVGYNTEGHSVIRNPARGIIPNIFNYRDFIGSNDGPYINRNLLKLRIVQYLKKENFNAAIVDIINYLKKTFYPNIKSTEIRYEIREMIYNGLLLAHATEEDLITNEHGGYNYPISLSDLSKIFLNGVMGTSVYYEVVCDDTPIQRNFIDEMSPFTRYEKAKLGDYLLSKSKTLILFVLYLRAIEVHEKKIFIDLKKTSEMNYKQDGYEIITNQHIERITRSMRDYIKKYLLYLENTEGSEKMAEFICNWFDLFEVPIKERELNNKGN